MSLEIQILQNIAAPKNAPVKVTLAGSLDTATAPELERKLAPVLAHPIDEIVFDLADLKFVSSAGLRIFSMARNQLKAKGGQVIFINMQPQIKEVFEIIKALPGLSIFKDIAEFDKYIAARQRRHEESE
jgi:anti-anti-sigma factor